MSGHDFLDDQLDSLQTDLEDLYADLAEAEDRALAAEHDLKYFESAVRKATIRLDDGPGFGYEWVLGDYIDLTPDEAAVILAALV